MVYTLTVHLYANDKPNSIDRIKAKLIEAARVYRKDKETVDWIVMQDVHDPRAFTIVERFEQESVRVAFLSFHLLPKGNLNTCDRSANALCRAKNTTLTTHTGRPLILTLYLSSINPWTFADTRNWTLARMWRFLSKHREWHKCFR